MKLYPIKIQDLRKGEYFKRKPDAKSFYEKESYDRSDKTWSASHEDDFCRYIHVKKDKIVFIEYDEYYEKKGLITLV